MFEQPKNIEVNDVIVPLLDESLKKERDAEPPREYLGASIIGDKCERKLAFGFHGYPSEFSGRTYRIFEMGDAVEEMMVRYLRLAGFTLKTHNKDGNQIGFIDAGGLIRGHCDGFILNGPEVPGLEYAANFECKGLKASSWKKVRKVGLREYSDTYFGQSQLYMGHFDLKQTLFTAYNKDTSEVHFEIVDFNRRDAQDASDRGLRVIQTKNPFEAPRVASRPEDFRCKFCDFAKECWEDRKPEKTTATPAWLKKKDQ